MDSDLEEGEIKDDGEESRAQLLAQKGKKDKLSHVGLGHNARSELPRRRGSRIRASVGHNRKKAVNGTMDTADKAPTQASNPVRVGRLRMDSLTRILNKRSKRRVEAFEDPRGRSSNSIIISVDSGKRNAKDSETKENKASYRSTSANRSSKSLSTKRSDMRLTEVERNAMISSLKNLTRKQSLSSGKNGMSDISDTSDDDDRSVVSIEAPVKPQPELITIDSSPESDGEDVEALQLRKQIIQDLMSKYENGKVGDIKEVQIAGGPSVVNEDEEPYSPVDDDATSHAKATEMIKSWLEEARKSNVVYPAVPVTSSSIQHEVSQPASKVSSVNTKDVMQYPQNQTNNVAAVEPVYTPVTSSNNVFYPNVFLPPSIQPACGDVDMRLLNFQGNAQSQTSLQQQCHIVMPVPDVFGQSHHGMSGFMQQQNYPVMNVPFAGNFPSDFSSVAVQNQSFSFADRSTLNYTGSVQMDSSNQWHQFPMSLDGVHGVSVFPINPPLPDTLPPVPPPPPPLDILPPQPVPSSALDIGPPGVSPIPSFSHPFGDAEPQKFFLCESKDVDDRAKAYAQTFEILNARNSINNTAQDVTLVTSDQQSLANLPVNTGSESPPVTRYVPTVNSDLKSVEQESRLRHSSRERGRSRSIHLRNSLENYRRSGSRHRRRDSYTNGKTDNYTSANKKRRNSSPSPNRQLKASKTNTGLRTRKRHSTAEEPSESNSPVPEETSRPDLACVLKEVTESNILESMQTFDLGPEMVCNDNVIKSSSSEPIVTTQPMTTKDTSDVLNYGADDEEILRAQLLLDMARKKNNSIPSPVTTLAAPATIFTQSVNHVSNIDLLKGAAVSKMPISKQSPPIYVKDNRPTILKSVSNPRSKNRQIVRVANTAGVTSLPNLRLQKTISNTAKPTAGPNSLHRIQRTVINTNLLKKNVYNKNADPVMRHLKITVPNKVVIPLIIPAGRDDSSSEDETSPEKEIRRLEPSHQTTESLCDGSNKSLPADFEMSLNNLLRHSRAQTSKPSKNSVARTSSVATSKRPAPNKPSGPSSEVVKHLPPSKLAEYQRLKLQLEAYERKIQKKERARQELGRNGPVNTIHSSNNLPDCTDSSTADVVIQPSSKPDLLCAQNLIHPSIPKGDAVVASKLSCNSSAKQAQQLQVTSRDSISLCTGVDVLVSNRTNVTTEEIIALDPTKHNQLAPSALSLNDIIMTSEVTNGDCSLLVSVPRDTLAEAVNLDVSSALLVADQGGSLDVANLDSDASSEIISAENEEKLLESDEESNVEPSISRQNDDDVHVESPCLNDNSGSADSIPENPIDNNNVLNVNDILSSEEKVISEVYPSENVETRVPEVQFAVQEREELYLREKLLKAALLKKMEVSNDKITVRKLEREVLSSRRAINRELTSLLSEMVKMSDLKVVLKNRQDKVISLREQLYAAEQQLNHTMSQLQGRENRRKALTTRVIDMRKRCVDVVRGCRLQGSKIDKNYKVPSGEYLEMKSKLLEVRNQNLVFQREHLKLKLSPRKKAMLEQQGCGVGHRKRCLSATLAAANRVKKSFNTCLKMKKRYGLSQSVYDPVKSTFKLTNTPQQLKSPGRRGPACYSIRKKPKNRNALENPMLLTKHPKEASNDDEAVFLLPKVLFQDVLTHETPSPVKYKSIPIVPYSIYQSPLDSIRKQKQLSDNSGTPGLVKNIDPFVTLCYFELRAMCNSSKCAFQHLYRPTHKTDK